MKDCGKNKDRPIFWPKLIVKVDSGIGANLTVLSPPGGGTPGLGRIAEVVCYMRRGAK
jgi:hypothetical protein